MRRLRYENHFFAFTSNSLQINDLQLNSFLHVQGSCRFLDPKFNIFFQDNSRENRLQLTFCANRPVAADPKPNPWYKTSLLESVSRTGTRKTKDKILNPNFLCLSCPSAIFALQYGGFVSREWLAARAHCYKRDKV